MLESRHSKFYTEKVDVGRQCARNGLYLVVVILSILVFCALVLSSGPAVFVSADGPDVIMRMANTRVCKVSCLGFFFYS